MKAINVASNMSTANLAELIVATLEEDDVKLKAIGAGAVNKAVKSIAVASQRLNVELKCSPMFFSTKIEGQEKSGIVLIIRKDD